MNPHTILCIVVRLKSSRLPRKALLEVNGDALVKRLTDRLSGLKNVRKIVWCTSTHPQDDPLEELGIRLGVSVYRGDELDVLSRLIEVGLANGADNIVRVTGDNPLTEPLTLDQMIESHVSNNAEYTYCEGLPRGTRAEVMSLDALERLYELVVDPKSSEYLTYQIKRPDHFKLNHFMVPSKLNRPELRLTIDTPEDFVLYTKICERFPSCQANLGDIIDWIDETPALAAINKDSTVKVPEAYIDIRLVGDNEQIFPEGSF